LEKKVNCEKCDISEDSANPMMNYLYTVRIKDFDEEGYLDSKGEGERKHFSQVFASSI